ncbi:MAG: hypothetical protein A3G81_13805 [Betaproteobacteria bacterium RIFCSPLOWO2_12_FULL_65_14]|nr:MAG: hypothetical protein A3G81_13805 [Betaproteobacteria bacterium RIFCSPLOWO2_12_FULL_65_14]
MTIRIAGAGPAGLAAAITLARAGREVVVHEARPEVGYRFGRDLQGLENWTVGQDVIAELEALGLSTAFAKLACTRGTVYDSQGRAHLVKSKAPILYLVERGPGPCTLDTALLAQALALGVTVRFRSRLERLEAPAVLAAGPKAAAVIAVGYHFDTAMPEGFRVICDDALAPQGYAYLLVMRGKGTVKSCMFSGFKSEQVYVERTVEAFQRLAGLEMRDARPHGGIGNFRIPASALIDGKNYDALWQRELRPWLRTSIVNRALYSTLGNRGYTWLLRRAGSTDAQGFLRRLYRPSWLKLALEPWARMRYRSRRQDTTCDHVACSCIWCRCGGILSAE